MKRNIQSFWDTHVIFWKWKVQTNKYLYIYIHTYVSPQESYTGRTAKKTCTSPEKKKYIRNSRKNRLYMYKAEEWIILRVPDVPKNIRSIIIHPYTLHILFYVFLTGVFFSLDYFWVLFCFFQLKMRAIEPKFLKSNGGRRPKPILQTFLDWSNGPRWYKSTCARMPQTT